MKKNKYSMMSEFGKLILDDAQLPKEPKTSAEKAAWVLACLKCRCETLGVPFAAVNSRARKILSTHRKMIHQKVNFKNGLKTRDCDNGDDNGVTRGFKRNGIKAETSCFGTKNACIWIENFKGFSGKVRIPARVMKKFHDHFHRPIKPFSFVLKIKPDEMEVDKVTVNGRKQLV